MTTQRKAAAALGLISAIGAYGGFVIPQVLNASNSATGSYTAAFFGFVVAYVVMLASAGSSTSATPTRNRDGTRLT